MTRPDLAASSFPFETLICLGSRSGFSRRISVSVVSCVGSVVRFLFYAIISRKSFVGFEEVVSGVALRFLSFCFFDVFFELLINALMTVKGNLCDCG